MSEHYLMFLRTVRIVEVIASAGVFVLNLSAWAQTIAYFSTAANVRLLIFLAVPGVVMVIGAGIQTIFHRLWPLGLLIAGAAATLYMCVLAFHFFDSVGYQWGRRVVVMDIFVVAIAFVAALVVAVPVVRGMFSTIGVEQIVGREPR